jgi:hypothetical protein
LQELRGRAAKCSPTPFLIARFSQRLQFDIWQLIQIAMNWEINCEDPEGIMDSAAGKMPLSHTWEINIASLLFSHEVEAGQYAR